ncbi:MAG: uroporphyrinogen decarboxylase family protein [bacterium]
MAQPKFPLKNDLLLRAIKFRPVPRVPVWLMRQAGRSDPAYLAYRETAGLTLHQLFRSPEHAIPISLLPRRIGVDAIIMFQDILTLLAPMGADFQFAPGPLLDPPIRSAEQVAALGPLNPQDRLTFVGETIGGLLQALEGDLPVVGFAGAPFTLAAFLIEGKSPGGGEKTLAFLAEQPAAFGLLMEKLTEATIAYLNYQIGCGVHAVQLFESVGDIIPRAAYQQFVQPSHERIFAALRPEAPAILFVKGSPFLDLMLNSGAAVLSVSHQTPLRAVLDGGGGRVAVQGNVDNRLLAEGSPAEVEAAVRNCLAEGGGLGHVLNLGHGLLAQTPFANVRRFVDTAHSVEFAQPG